MRRGFYLAAIRGGDRAARSLGVPILRYKLYALLLSAGFTSLAGTRYRARVSDGPRVLDLRVDLRVGGATGAATGTVAAVNGGRR